MNEYFNKLNFLPSNKVIKDMRKNAIKNKIPVINDEGLSMMLQLVDLIKPKRFLEIGTAIGYCAINIASHNNDVIIDTIERNEELYNEAIKNIKASKFEGRINVYLADALEFDLSQLTSKYDMIFIDAAKAQYIKFFELYESLLEDQGIIVTDNLLFHGFVTNTHKIKNKNLKSLVIKIEEYNYWLSKNKKYNTSFFNIGDGLAISKKVIK